MSAAAAATPQAGQRGRAGCGFRPFRQAGRERGVRNLLSAFAAGNPPDWGTRNSWGALFGPAVAEPEVGAQDVDAPVQQAPLLGDLLFALRDDVVREGVQVHVQLAAQLRNLALAALELLELDEHLVQVEKGLGRHSSSPYRVGGPWTSSPG